MSPSSTSTDPFKDSRPGSNPPPAPPPPKDEDSIKALSLGLSTSYLLFLGLLIGAAFLPRCGWICESQGVACVQEQPIRRSASEPSATTPTLDGGTELPDAGVTTTPGGQGLVNGGVATTDAGERQTGSNDNRQVERTSAHFCLSDCALIYYVILLGMLGGWLHGVSSMATFAGMKKLDESWWTFYVTRPLVGGATALLVYFTLQSGIAGFSIPTDLWRGQMALLAWAGVAGLSSTVAMKKMRDVLDALFRPDQRTETKPAQTNSAEPPPTPAPASSTTPPPTPATKPDVQTPTAAVAPKPAGKPSSSG